MMYQLASWNMDCPFALHDPTPTKKHTRNWFSFIIWLAHLLLTLFMNTSSAHMEDFSSHQNSAHSYLMDLQLQLLPSKCYTCTIIARTTGLVFYISNWPNHLTRLISILVQENHQVANEALKPMQNGCFCTGNKCLPDWASWSACRWRAQLPLQ